MITTVGLVNTSITPHNYQFFGGEEGVRTFKIYSVGTSKYIILLTIIIMLNIRSQNLISLYLEVCIL